MFAITGVTGKVGGEVARSLLAAGHPVRAVVRDEGKGDTWARLGCEVAVAAMEDSAALATALKGATGAFVLPPPLFDPRPGYPEAHAVADSIVHALKLAAPEKVVSLSTIGADAHQDNLLSQHTVIEAALRAVPLPLTILRPAWFIDNAAWDVGPARDTGTIQSYLQPLDRPVPMVAAVDVGRMAACLLQEEWSGRRILELEGPRRLAPLDVADALATVLGKPVRVEAVPRDRWEALFRAQGMKNPMPRMRMIDGFNEGWIAFGDNGRHAMKGTTDMVTVLKTLVARP